MPGERKSCPTGRLQRTSCVESQNGANQHDGLFSGPSPYGYGRVSLPGVVHVGWLDSAHPFTQGTVDGHLIQKLRLLAAEPVELCRGFHICELCAEPDLPKETLPPHHVVLDINSPYGKWLSLHQGNGEIRVPCAGVIFAAPVLIVHYIEEHGYLPPAQFLKAVEESV